ncbi:MAG: GNAT family N-acetyltransferase [Novosphingobium sp.]|nr:GNAT family N-acetyltransferase [Novosphingobium sp.]
MPGSSIATARPVTPEEAFVLARRFCDLRYTQHPGYAIDAARAVGARADFLSIERGIEGSGEPIGFAAVRLKALPVIGGGLAYLHRGPACATSRGFDPYMGAACVDAVVRHYRHGGYLLRLSSPLWADGEAALEPHYRRLGFRRAPGGTGRTMVIDLAPPLEALRSALDQKWRTDLNRALRGEVRITRSSDPADFARFQPLLTELADKKGFHTRQDATFFGAVARHDPGAGEIQIHLAWAGDELLGGHVGAYTGDTAVYLLGATTAAGRNARASYLLQWSVIEHARERGLAWYDLGGIDAVANPDVYRFKKRMGGREVCHAAQWELATGLIAPPVVRLAEKARTLLARR